MLLLLFLCCSQPSNNFPNGVKLQNRNHFAVDTETKTHSFSVTGHANSKLFATLVDHHGRREIIFNGGMSGNCHEIVATGNWNLPPAAAMNAKGEVLVCWNHLPGKDTEITLGPLPDPTHGSDLYCSLYSPDCKLLANRVRFGEKENDEASFYKVAWLKNVTATENHNFNVSFYHESGWFTKPTLPEHGYYLQTFNPALKRAEKPLFVQPACLEDQ